MNIKFSLTTTIHDQRNQRLWEYSYYNVRPWFAICDGWILICFLCFKVRCVWSRVSEKRSNFYLYSSKFFYLLIYWNMVSFKCSYRASKSKWNTDMEGWKRIGTSPLTHFFVSFCLLLLLLLVITEDATVTVRWMLQKNPKSWNVFWQ